LLAVKGKPKRLEMDVREVIFAPVGRHSEKPDEVRRRIERLVGPGLELFARKSDPVWVTWGNEIARVATRPEALPSDIPRTAANALETDAA
jgi:N6-adenosine-specific RNA methylase IME4